MTASNAFICTTCQQVFPLNTREWRCSCGGLFDLQTWPALDPSRFDASQSGLWRYRDILPLEAGWEAVTLGEERTALLPVKWEGLPVSFKLESQCPTGSFKDRGASILVTALRGLDVERIVDDSSGNAGASLAAYTARAGIDCDICVPYAVAGPKLIQTAAYGAEIVEIKGKREYAALAAWAAAAHGAYYASHVYNPFFLAGTETLAYELWEQLDRRAPGGVVMPVGNGSLLLGVYRGFQRLLREGLVDRMPRLYGVQAEKCAPIYQAFVQGRDTIEATASCPTLATGIAIGNPMRGPQILAAVRDSRGAMVTVSDQDIGLSHRKLARQGFYLEETAATAVAALPALADHLATMDREPVVVVLTGHGLKTSTFDKGDIEFS